MAFRAQFVPDEACPHNAQCVRTPQEGCSLAWSSQKFTNAGALRILCSAPGPVRAARGLRARTWLARELRGGVRTCRAHPRAHLRLVGVWRARERVARASGRRFGSAWASCTRCARAAIRRRNKVAGFARRETPSTIVVASSPVERNCAPKQVLKARVWTCFCFCAPGLFGRGPDVDPAGANYTTEGARGNGNHPSTPNHKEMLGIGRQ